MTRSGPRQAASASTVMSIGAALDAFTEASLAAEAKYLPAEAFVTGSDRRLGDAEIQDLAVGNTLVGVTYAGQQFRAYLDASGKADKLDADGSETGTWRIVAGELLFRFPALANGAGFGLRIYRHGDSALLKGWSPGFQRWIWFLLEPGRAVLT